MTRGDKIAFGLIALLLVLVLVFRKDLASVFDGDNKDGDRKEKKKDKNKKEGWWVPTVPDGKEERTVLYTHSA
jgi:hypothetical protein